jgi:single-strand DNA-binding protein
MGRLVANPELKTTSSGHSVTSFRVAVDRSYVKNGEERKADFIDIVCWRQTAEFVCKHFVKGSLIALEGQLQTRNYKDKDGNDRYVVEVMADNVSFTGERRDNSPVTTRPSNNEVAKPKQAYTEDDDLPF